MTPLNQSLQAMLVSLPMQSPTSVGHYVEMITTQYLSRAKFTCTARDVDIGPNPDIGIHGLKGGTPWFSCGITGDLKRNYVRTFVSMLYSKDGGSIIGLRKARVGVRGQDCSVMISEWVIPGLEPLCLIEDMAVGETGTIQLSFKGEESS